MFDFLLDGAFAPFTTALALLLGLLVLELIALVLGGSLLGADSDMDLELDLDADIGDLGIDLGPDVDLDAFELAEVEPEVSASATAAGPASWLGLGQVPTMIWIAVLLMGFGLSGMGLQLVLRDVFEITAPAWLAAIPAAVFGLWFARGFGRVFARLLPKTETAAQSERMLARRRGIITQGTAARGRPAEVRVTDRFGNTHYLRAEPMQDGEELAQGTEVLVLRNRQTGSFVLIGLSD